MGHNSGNLRAVVRTPRLPSAAPATVITAAAADATRMCDVPPRRRSAVWEAMPTRAEGEPMKSDTEIMDDVIDELH